MNQHTNTGSAVAEIIKIAFRGVPKPEARGIAHAVIDALRDLGYAVTAFNPDELRGSPAGQIQDLMTSRGWDAIETLATERKSNAEVDPLADGDWMTPEQAAEAAAEGWGLFDVDSSGVPQIQKDDDSEVFYGDEAAWQWVVARAAEKPDSAARAALDFVKKHNPTEHRTIMSVCHGADADTVRHRQAVHARSEKG